MPLLVGTIASIGLVAMALVSIRRLLWTSKAWRSHGGMNESVVPFVGACADPIRCCFSRVRSQLRLFCKSESRLSCDSCGCRLILPTFSVVFAGECVSVRVCVCACVCVRAYRMFVNKSCHDIPFELYSCLLSLIESSIVVSWQGISVMCCLLWCRLAYSKCFFAVLAHGSSGGLSARGVPVDRV